MRPFSLLLVSCTVISTYVVQSAPLTLSCSVTSGTVGTTSDSGAESVVTYANLITALGDAEANILAAGKKPRVYN